MNELGRGWGESPFVLAPVESPLFRYYSWGGGGSLPFSKAETVTIQKPRLTWCPFTDLFTLWEN